MTIPVHGCRPCSDGSGCISRWEACNGYPLCNNGEDESEAMCKGIAFSFVFLRNNCYDQD